MCIKEYGLKNISVLIMKEVYQIVEIWNLSFSFHGTSYKTSMQKKERKKERHNIIKLFCFNILIYQVLKLIGCSPN